MIHLGIIVFLVLAAIGVWATFDPRAGALRFSLLCASAGAFVLISHGGRNIRGHAIRGFALLGVAVSIGLLLQPVAGSLLDTGESQFARRGMQIAAGYETKFPAGFVVVALPFLIYEWRNASEDQIGWPGNVWLAAVFVALTSILLSGSIASILLVGLGGAVGVTWWLSSTVSRLLSWNRGSSLLVSFLGVSGAGMALALVGARAFPAAFDFELVGSRLEIAAQAVRLVGDYPILGGGLGSIPGSYAHYIRGLPVFFIPHSQNLYLNLAIELGLIALLAFVVTFTASAIMLVCTRADSSKLIGTRSHAGDASLLGLCLILVLGLIDDPLYMSWLLPLLFVFPGLAISFAADRPVSIGKLGAAPHLPHPVLVMVLVAAIGLMAANWAVLKSSWLSNLGAIQMAKIELRNWPSGQWSDGKQVRQLTGPEMLFEQALQIQSRNRTALHRLGLIAMERREYGRAADLLGEAHHLDRGHRGIRKAYGYSLVWSGKLPQAANVLRGITEAKNELMIYEGWWRRRGRPTFAKSSLRMFNYLESSQP